jgi:hypothetical protein
MAKSMILTGNRERSKRNKISESVNYNFYRVCDSHFSIKNIREDGFGAEPTHLMEQEGIR